MEPSPQKSKSISLDSGSWCPHHEYRRTPHLWLMTHLPFPVTPQPHSRVHRHLVRVRSEVPPRPVGAGAQAPRHAVLLRRTRRWRYLYLSSTTSLIYHLLWGRKHTFPSAQAERAKTHSLTTCLVAAGLLGQAVVSLQPDILDVIRGKADVTLQSTIHQSSAGVLFLAGYTHCIMMDMVLHRSRVLPTTLASKRYSMPTFDCTRDQPPR